MLGMNAIYETHVVPERHTIYLRLSGMIREGDMRRLCEQYRTLTASLCGRKHFILADLRGMTPVSQECARMMGEAIAFGRRHGVVRCAHVSDAAIARLQNLRLAREAPGGDEVTVDVASVEEAERVLEEARLHYYPEREGIPRLASGAR
jgi:hypothetical protein